MMVKIATRKILQIPIEYIKDYKIIPLEENEHSIIIGTICSDISSVIQYLKFLYKKEVILKVLSEEEANRLITIYYGHILYYTEKNNDNREFISPKDQDKYINTLCDYLIINSIEKGASDIHIEPGEEDYTVRYRINGSLVVFSIIPYNHFLNVISKIKVLSGMNIAEKRIPQDGKMVYEYCSNAINIRASTMPTVRGEKMVLRLLYSDNLSMSFENIYFQNYQRLNIEKMIKHSHGIILITGPTGSGKSTTLYSLINKLNKEDVNISTVEDPVEINIQSVNQTNVNEKAGITFSRGLRSLLRQDPDIIMIGEIRDEETAQIAIRAAITGHLVLSTIHTNTAFGVITRLKDMKVENYLLKDALIGVISQRLLKKLCDKCKVRKINSKYFTAVGCKECNYTGYKGRILISETIYFPEFYKINEDMDFFKINEIHKNKYGNMFSKDVNSLLNQGILDYIQGSNYINEETGEDHDQPFSKKLSQNPK